MKAFIVFALFAVAACAAAEEEPIPILKQESDVSFDGNFQHSFETGNGIKVQEQGVLKNAGVKDAEASEVTGSFEYTDSEGTKYAVHYVANENGYQPEGDHLPTPPPPQPIPEYIQRALDWIAAHPEPEEKVVAKKL